MDGKAAFTEVCSLNLRQTFAYPLTSFAPVIDKPVVPTNYGQQLAAFAPLADRIPD